jgi:hypothetical protein
VFAEVLPAAEVVPPSGCWEEAAALLARLEEAPA